MVVVNQATTMHTTPNVVPLHRGFVMRDYRLDLSFADGTVFFGTVSAISHEMAEEVACSRAHQRPEHIVRSDSRPMPLNNGFSDTLPTLDTSSALADMANALRRSEAVAEDLAAPAAPVPASLLHRAATAVRQLDAPAGCQGTGCRQGRDMPACDCNLLGRWRASQRAHQQQPLPAAIPQRRAHTASDVIGEMRIPLRRRDLVLAALAVTLSAVAIVLWSMPATWAS